MYDNPFHTGSLKPYSFLVTGGAGFIGSHLVEYLLKYEAGRVRVLDNLLTGNIESLKPFQNYSAFEFFEGDIRDQEICAKACEGIDFVLHQAALGSVQRSILDPLTTHDINVGGFLKMLIAAKEKGVKRFIYASSSSVYGDHPVLPKVEDTIGKPLSPYAVSKYSNELYAGVFAKTYGIEVIGMRYFNVFGPRQNAMGPYAAVIPSFVYDLKKTISPIIYGDGSQSRDFTFIENVIQANIKAIFADKPEAINQVYNIACGEQHTVLELLELIRKKLCSGVRPQFELPRKGDISHSLADISKAKGLLNYQPDFDLKRGLEIMLER